MRTGYFYSLVFAFLTSVTIAATAAPVESSGTKAAPQIMAQTSKPQAPKVDLNVADATTLEHEMAGIGRIKAEAIVAYREINGPFSSVEELLEVKGIGKAILDRNRDKLEAN